MAKLKALLQVDDESSDAVKIQAKNAQSTVQGSFRRRRRRKTTPLPVNPSCLLSKVYYIGSFAILGSSLRAFLGRMFGSDCTNVTFDNHPVGDVSESFTSKICITSDGRLKMGGSLFTDLPANMLGS